MDNTIRNLLGTTENDFETFSYMEIGKIRRDTSAYWGTLPKKKWAIGRVKSASPTNVKKDQAAAILSKAS